MIQYTVWEAFNYPEWIAVTWTIYCAKMAQFNTSNTSANVRAIKWQQQMKMFPLYSCIFPFLCFLCALSQWGGRFLSNHLEHETSGSVCFVNEILNYKVFSAAQQITPYPVVKNDQSLNTANNLCLLISNSVFSFVFTNCIHHLMTWFMNCITMSYFYVPTFFFMFPVDNTDTRCPVRGNYRCGIWLFSLEIISSMLKLLMYIISHLILCSNTFCG